jgi:uncharacterized protein (TIGR00255 family)
MTGYGSAKGSCAGMNIGIEIRSVNNRYLDCSVRLPRNFLFAEDAIKSRVQAFISRGKVDVFVSVENDGTDEVTVRVNEPLARSYAEAVHAVSDKLGLSESISAYDICRLPDVLSVEKQDLDTDALTAAFTEIADAALREHDRMRTREGQKLSDDITGRLETVEAYVGDIEKRSPETVAQYREKLYRKMCEVLESTAVDEQRILLEAGIFADKVAVDEETVRLRSHVSQMRGMLKTGSPIGRKMDFLTQEFNRESNTIGSKCSDPEITKVVIELKSEIEKIREQVQNIE